MCILRLQVLCNQNDRKIDSCNSRQMNTYKKGGGAGVTQRLTSSVPRWEQSKYGTAAAQVSSTKASPHRGPFLVAQPLLAVQLGAIAHFAALRRSATTRHTGHASASICVQSIANYSPHRLQTRAICFQSFTSCFFRNSILHIDLQTAGGYAMPPFQSGNSAPRTRIAPLQKLDVDHPARLLNRRCSHVSMLNLPDWKPDSGPG